MKKYSKWIISGIIVVAITIFSFFYFGKGKTSEEMVSQITIGMSVKDVETILAYPKESTDDNATISENVYDSYKDMNNLNSIVQDDQLELKMEQLNTVYNASENGEHVKEYVYQTSDRDVQIYFVGGAVEYVNFEME